VTRVALVVLAALLGAVLIAGIAGTAVYHEPNTIRLRAVFDRHAALDRLDGQGPAIMVSFVVGSPDVKGRNRKTVEIAPVDYAEVERLVGAGYYLSFQEFAREALKEKLERTKAAHAKAGKPVRDPPD